MWNVHRTHFPIGDPRAVLYGTPRKETILKLAEATPTGCFVEFGVYQGGSAWRLAKLAETQGRSCHLFDTFCGIPERSDIDTFESGHLGDVDLAEVRKLIPTGIFHVGIFPATMPDEFEPVAFAHIDCDQYQSCVAAIDRFWPLVVPGGIMLFDDYNVTPGVTKAVNDRFGDQIQITREDKAYVVK